MRNVSLFCGISALALLATAAPGFAQAQESAADDSGSASDSSLGDIVVTAQRRSQKLQDVPIAVAAVGSEALQSAQIRSTADLTAVVPGLRANVQVTYFQPFIRGIGGSSTLPGNEAPVALYIDGVYMSMKEANNFDLNNIERIEVLKGPQGTLFGRNATGGAINIITKAPSQTLEANFDVSYGRFDEVVTNAYLSGPITPTLAASASVRYQNIGDGYQKNIVTGTDFGTFKSFSGMVKLRWQPTPELTVTGEHIYFMRNGIDDEQGTPNAAVTPKAALIPGTIISYTPYRISQNNDPEVSVHDNKSILDVRYDAGGVQFVSITGYDRGNSTTGAERDRSSAPLVYTPSDGIARTFTQELQIQSNNDSKLSWIVGAYYYHSKEGYRNFRVQNGVPGSGTVQDFASVFGQPGVSASNIDVDQIARSVAGFADATLELGENTKVTAGFRYTEERRSLDGTRSSITAPPPGTALVFTPLATVDLSTKFSKPTWRFTVDHHFSRDVMAYISYNRGFRSGAYNPTVISQTQVPLQPEVIDAYEVGLKSELFDRRLRLNLATFYYDYRGVHVSVRTPSTGQIVQQNAGGARIYGLDLDFAARITEGLSLTGGFNLLHARYHDYANASTFVIDPVNGGGRQITMPNAKGQPMSFAPDFTANLGFDYSLPLSNESRFAVSGNYFVTSKFSRQVGTVFGKEEVQGYDQLNGSITWYAPEDRFFVRAWGRNLTNHKVLGSTLDSYAYFYVVQRPITYGMSLGFKI